MVAKINTTQDLENFRREVIAGRDPARKIVSVCAGTGCQAYGCLAVKEAIAAELEKADLKDSVDLVTTGCHGLCEKGPLVLVRPDNIFYQRVKPKNVPEIIEKTVVGGEVIDKLLYRDPATKKRALSEEEIPFYAHQQRVVLEGNGLLDPASLEDYLAFGGFTALAKALFEMTPEEVIDEIKKSGLRGRGGGGFPTGRKWASARRVEGDVKYVICNADEGDPGAYMDRSILEGNPYIVLEGMLIGAYAVGNVDAGYIYVRQEYPGAVRLLGMAVEALRERGLLGENILGSELNFDLTINRGGGAFVCGESTALMASVEGKRGDPRSKYIHTVEVGLWGKPTVLNNVETWANVPIILNRGADWFASIGTEGSKGTKVFSLVGNVKNTGLVEVPMGITLREIIFDIGGGITKGRKFKGVQTGGPSGGCIPESLLDMPVDFDELTNVGSMMGSGGMIVMDEDTCMVDVARYFLSFLGEESCGKCTPCREGVRVMTEILDRITEGEGREGDIELLEEIGLGVQRSSLCGLGQTAPNPLLSTIKYFREEYEAHIRDKKCPGGVCKALITYSIDPEKCTGCTLCALNCPEDCIAGEKKEVHVIDAAKCIKCNTCYELCNFGAVLRQ
jgi:NADH:ubiquinone oxidoreductase subunit F (NADH-binding)/(2Fe-2S) ferredoxin/NAD-dependent dihydropyrimidine dehydrogenase PreA subunit